MKAPAPLVPQRVDADCVLCCVAMLTARPYAQVRSLAGALFDERRGIRDEMELLEAAGFSNAWKVGLFEGDALNLTRGDMAHDAFRTFAWGRHALIFVPSRHRDDLWHMVYWDGREVRDPDPAQPYRRFEEMLPEAMILFADGAVDRLRSARRTGH